MKKILLLTLFTIFSITSTNANSVDFYWEKDGSWWLWESEVSQIQEQIDLLQDKTWLNTDVVILWKDDKQWCYTNPNFDYCVKENYGYWSDIIITLKMKSDISSRGDIRSYMNNVNYPVLTTGMLKSIQDSIVYNFWNNDFKKGIIEYYNKLDSRIIGKCTSYKNENKNFWWKDYNSDCKIKSLIDLNEKNKVLKEKAKEEASFKRNINIVITIVIVISFMIWMQIYYLWRLKKLFKDIKFQLLDLDKWKTFKWDLENTKKELEELIKRLEIYLWNADKIWIKTRKYYLNVNKESKKIKEAYEKSIENYNNQDKLKKDISDFKDINI